MWNQAGNGGSGPWEGGGADDPLPGPVNTSHHPGPTGQNWASQLKKHRSRRFNPGSFTGSQRLLRVTRQGWPGAEYQHQVGVRREKGLPTREGCQGQGAD